MNFIEVSLILSIVSCILIAILLPLTMYALILVKSLEKQTHTVQFMPTSEALDPSFSDQKVFEDINQDQKEENEEYGII